MAAPEGRAVKRPPKDAVRIVYQDRRGPPGQTHGYRLTLYPARLHAVNVKPDRQTNDNFGTRGRVVFLVTGGAGFIGSHLVARLVEKGDAVRVLDNFSTGAAKNLAAVQRHIDLIEGDLRDREAVRRAVDGVRVVFHQAALSSVQGSIEDPSTTVDVNITGTLNVLEAARDAGCRRVVFASSASVYGDAPELPKTEVLTPHPLSPYAISKLAGEQLCSVFTRVHGLETVGFRYFNVFGPGQDPSSPYSGVISHFLRAIQSGSRPVIYGDGEQTRDFVYISNVVEANLKAAFVGEAAGRIFNIASGQAVTINHLLKTMAKVTGSDARAIHERDRPGDIRHSLADISEARRVLGYAVDVPLEEGLIQLVSAWHGESQCAQGEPGDQDATT